jgi:hypothetical protein
MRIFDEPQDVIRMLQSPATESELAGEQAAIDQMVGARGGSVAAVTRRRPYRLAALVAAGVIGFGGVAAAGPGGFDPLQLGPTSEDVENEPVMIEPVTTEEVDGEFEDQDMNDVDVEEKEEDSDSDDDDGEEQKVVAPADADVEPSDTPLFDDDPATPNFDETRCKAGPHGATVSAVARGDEGFEDLDVVDAAHSSCGKKTLMPYSGDDDTVEGSEDVDKTLEPAEAPEELEQESTERPGKKAKSNNAGHGNGKGKAKGKGGRGG